MEHRSLWPLALAGLVLGTAAMLAGALAGGEFGPMATSYGLLITLAAVYMCAGLAIRERAWRRLSARVSRAPVPGSLHGRRVF
jgi:hypothetical protein